MPRILVTNDDGYAAPGIRALREALDGLGEVIVVAPDRERSAASQALTVSRPVRVREHRNGEYSVDGTPADCVHVGLFHILEREVDLVVSGINHGANLGDDIGYSGTVSAAVEARLLGVPALAVSAEAREDVDFRAAGRVARRLAERGLAEPWPERVVLNANVPAVEPRGWRWTRQGRRAYRAGVTERVDPGGRRYFWLMEERPRWLDDPHSDHAALADGYVSVTPLRVDLTDDEALEELRAWRLGSE